MSEIPMIGAIFKIKFFQESRKPRVLAGYVLGISQAGFLAWNYVRFSSGMEIQFMEPFIMLMNNWYSYTLIALGYFIVIADAPFVDNLSHMVMVRSGGRYPWARAMCFYMAWQAVLYLGVSALASFAVCSLGTCIRGNGWSEPLHILMQVQPVSAVKNYGFVFFSAEVLEKWLPYTAFLHCFSLAVLYLYSLALVLFGLNLLTSFPLGSFAVLLIHFVGVLGIKNEGFFPMQGSLLANAVLEFHDGRPAGLGLGYSYVQFFILCAAVWLGVKYIMRRCDYRVANNGRLW